VCSQDRITAKAKAATRDTPDYYSRSVELQECFMDDHVLRERVYSSSSSDGNTAVQSSSNMSQAVSGLDKSSLPESVDSGRTPIPG
jgi:hypothetical protein